MPFCKLQNVPYLEDNLVIFANLNSNYARIMRPLHMVQNTVTINKNEWKYFFVQYYGRPKELFDFNKLAKLFYQIIFEGSSFYNEIIVEKL